ncbi:putative disease resistance protein [Acorus gramineus]|uniref:Disease resistance protein n=1 Tax=Acorus gramineus TaxID=55184 RepID=A0AAV9B4C0_ACOGR|nr:putative disease resistance protein [Acorus gramineus]
MASCLKSVRWVVFFLGVSNVGVLFLGGFLVVSVFSGCGDAKKLPFMAVAAVAAVRVMAMVGAGVAQKATATTIVAELQQQPLEGSIVDEVVRHERRIFLMLESQMMVVFGSVLEEDEVYSVARLLGDLVAYRASGTGHLELLAGLALLQRHSQCPDSHSELMEAPEAQLQEAAAFHQFAEAAYTGPLLDFGRNPVLFPCAWLHRQGFLTPWTRNRRPVLEGDNWWRGHAAAFLKYTNVPPEALRCGRVSQRDTNIFGTSSFDIGRSSDQLSHHVKQTVLSSFPHYGHSGIIQAARELFMQIDGKPEGYNQYMHTNETKGFLSSLLGTGCECYGYNIRIVGHSLGGAVGTLLGIRLYQRYPNLHVYSYGTLPCVDPVVAEACSDFVTSIIYNDEFSARLSISSVLRLRAAAIKALSDESSTDSALISKLARRILQVNRHQVSSVADHTNPTPPFQPGVGSIEDGGHMYRRRHFNYTVKGGAFLCAHAVSCMLNMPAHRSCSHLVDEGHEIQIKDLSDESRSSSAFTVGGCLQTGHIPLFREGTSLIDDLNPEITRVGFDEYTPQSGTMSSFSESEALKHSHDAVNPSIRSYFESSSNVTDLVHQVIDDDALSSNKVFVEDPPEMYLPLPGLIIHIVPEQRSILPIWKSWIAHDRKGEYRAFLANRESFKDIIVSPYMFLDHLPWRVHHAMLRVLETQRAQVEMEAVSPVIEVVKCVCNPAVRYVGYAKNLKKNFEKLDKMARDLYDRRADIQVLVRNTAGAGKIPSSRCETWLKDVEDIEKQMVEMKEKYEQEKKCFKGFCPNVYSRMMFGKHVEVKFEEVSKLVNTFTSDEGVLVDAPVRLVEMVPAPRVEVDSSTARTVQKILEHLRDGRKQRIGVWGMGGVGKTTVMKMVNNLPEISQMFAVVIWVTVSGDSSIRKFGVDNSRRECVKMHDVIRDLALRITSHGGGEGRIYLARAESVDCPVLTTLFLQRNNQLKAIPESFLEGMPALRVLDLSGTSIKQLPPSLCRLKNLRGLYLRKCSLLFTLPPEIGSLKSLEVLVVTGIRYLPIEIGELGRLQHLRVSFSRKRDDDTEHEVQKMIPDEVISRLTHLEDLRIAIDMEDERWNEIVEAVTEEIGALKELCRLDFCFASVENLEHFINISQSWNSGLLKSFRFAVSRPIRRDQSTMVNRYYWTYGLPSQLDRWLMFKNCNTILDVPVQVFRRADSFIFWNCTAFEKLEQLGEENLSGLKFFLISNCDFGQTLIGGGCKLPNLEQLRIEESSNMLNIWECNSSLTPPLLGNLRVLIVEHCSKLKYVFPKGVLPYVPNLETVYVLECEDVKQIIVGEVTNNTLQKLNFIMLDGLGKLDRICEGFISWPLLDYVHIRECGKLRRLPFGTDSAPSLKTIGCRKEWWDSLEWEDNATRYRFQSLAQFSS